MGSLRTLFTKPFPDCLSVLPGGAFLVVAFYVLAGGWLHYVFVYALVTGKIRVRFPEAWTEARESTPVLYWFYVAAFGAVVLVIDGMLVYSLIRRRNER
jgi:hypothetical protein